MSTKLSKQLDLATIRSECSESSFQRGKSYFNSNRVTDFHIDQELAASLHFSSRVKGSLATPYKQLIVIKWHGDSKPASISGRCTCPIGYNCKHVAAACLEYQKRLQAKALPETTQACFDWLESLVEDTAGDLEINRDFLAYVIKQSGAKQELSIEFAITKIKKNGGFNKGRSVTPGSLNFSFGYGYKLPHYLQPQDEEIVRLVSSMTSIHSYHSQLKGKAGGLALASMLDTGRLFWQNLERPPLQAGSERPLHYVWETDRENTYRLKVHPTPQAELIPTEPPYYLDSQLGTLGRIHCPQLNTAQLRKLLHAPPVPARHAEQFSQRLLFDFPNLQLPSPKQIEIKDIENLAPRPKLTLQGIAEADGRYHHRVELAFNYGEHRVRAGKFETFACVKSPLGYLRIRRDAACEQHCIDTLLDAGFNRSGNADQADLLLEPGMNDPVANARQWHDFLFNVLPELESRGWSVEKDEGFRLKFRSAENWRAEIQENHSDWFEMHFNVDIDGQSIPLLPLLLPVLENYNPDNLPKTLTVPLGQHDFLSLPGDKLRPFLAVLYEVFGNNPFPDGTIKLSRFDAPTLAEFESSGYGLFSLRGGQALLELGRKINNFTGIVPTAPPAGLQVELRHYQQSGLNWLQFLREYQFGGILADDMGLGKTVQTLAHLLIEKHSGRMNKPCLVIAPTSLMSNWRREANRFTPDLRVLTLQGVERKRQFENIGEYDLVLTTYPLLPRDEASLLANQYYYLILDEAQIVKNPHAKAAKIVRTIHADHRLCLSGTPMENHLGELWAQFDFLMPGFLGNSSEFKRIYRTPIETQGDGERKQRLCKRIRPFLLRRTKQEVAAELPQKSEMICSVPLGRKQAVLYETLRLTMEQKVRYAIAEKGLARSHITILDALLKLRQTCCDPRILPLAEAKKVKESAKLDLLMEMLPGLLAEGRRILVFSQFTRMIRLIENELELHRIGYSKLTGQTRNRDETIAQFKSGATSVFLISLKAGGVGLNLTEADTVIIYDPWWNPAVEHQAADRAHRLGQDKPVFVYKLVTENTVEEKILTLQAQKNDLAQGIYQSGEQNGRLSLSADDLRTLFEPL